MARLTNAIKENFVANVISKGFDEKTDQAIKNLKDYCTCKIELGLQVIRDSIELCTDYIMYTTECHININSSAYYETRVIITFDFPLPTKDGDYVFYAVDDEKLKELYDAHMVLKKEKEEATKAVEAILNSVTTIKQLRDIIPECTELLPENLVNNLVPIDTINKVRSLLLNSKE